MRSCWLLDGRSLSRASEASFNCKEADALLFLSSASIAFTFRDFLPSISRLFYATSSPFSFGRLATLVHFWPYGLDRSSCMVSSGLTSTHSGRNTWARARYFRKNVHLVPNAYVLYSRTNGVLRFAILFRCYGSFKSFNIILKSQELTNLIVLQKLKY